MKRSRFTKFQKGALLAVPTAALMLGAAQAQTTIGLNFQTWYYNSGQNPQTIGFNNGYSAYNATGFPVTATAFGVAPANWFNTDPLFGNPNNGGNPLNQACTFGGTSTNFDGSLSCFVNSQIGGFQSGSGCEFASGITFPSYAPGVWCPPGDDEMLWGIIVADDSDPFSVSVSGLAAKFPHGYVIQAMAALGNTEPLLPSVDFTDGSTTSTSAFHIWLIRNLPTAQWPTTTAGLSDPSGVFTADTIFINSRSDGTGVRTALAGFILTDQPVISQLLGGGPTAFGLPFQLSASVAALPTGLTYQWRKNGTPISGANSATYSVAAAANSDSGNYDLVVNNLYGSVTGAVTTVTVGLNVWDAPVTIAGDTDVATNGTTVFAYAWSSNSASVNGVNFTAPDVGATLSGFDGGNYNGYGAAIASLSSDYQTALTGGQYSSAATPCTVTLTSLIAGHEYLVQLWVDDSRSGFGARMETLNMGDNTITLGYTSSGGAGGLGQYTVGTFVATTTSLVITLAGNASTQINALQLRDLGISPVVPAPVFTPSAGLYLGAQAVSISTAGKIFYTTNGTTPTSSSAVYSGPITVPVNTTMKITAFATNTAQADSAVASATYTTFATPAVPTWITAAGGSWTNTANWSNGVVANGSGVTADFSTLNLTSNVLVTVDGAPTVGQLILGDTTPDHNWTLNAGSGGPLELASSNTPAIKVNNQTTTINAVLAGTQGLNKTGAGYLTLGGANSYLGTAAVLAGTLEAQAKSGDQPYVVTNGATLKIGYTTGGGYANTAMQIYGDGTAATTGLYLKGGTTYNVAGGVVVNNAPTTIRQYGSGLAGIGTFDINRTPGLSISAAASGSATDPNIQIVNAGYGMVITTAAGANTATGDLVINGPLNVTGQYGLLTEGNGSVRLNGVGNPANAALNVIGGSVICGTANCVGTNAFLNVGAVNASGVAPAAGTVFDLNGTSQTVSNAALAGTLKMTINKGGTPKCNTLNCWGQPATFGGTLSVNNLGGALALGDSFTLFPTPAGSGFATLMLPTVGNGLAWQDDSTVDGTIKVIAGSVPPSIVTDLSGTTNIAYVGGGFTFAISASGDPTLRYQWLLNGTTVVGSDSPTLILTSLTLGAAGNYSCTVTNNYGVAQSQTNYLQVSIPNTYEAAVIATAPTAFWPLDEADGTTAFDVFGNYNATYLGNYTQDYALNPATGTQGAHFDGGSGEALTSYAPALNPAVFTAAAWVNPDTTPSSEFCVLSCGQFASPRSGWLIYQFPNNWDLRTYNGNGTTIAAEAVGTSAPTLGTWEHLAVSWDGTTARLYVNGVLEGTNVPTASPKYVPGASGGFCAGARADSSFYFPGTVSSAVFYNRVLIPQEISALAGSGPFVSTNPTNLTAKVSGGNLNLSWPLDHTGWRLLVQTNHLASGLSANPSDWGTVPGANTANQISIPIGTAQTGEFYRLVYP